ncbi:hypothetical protein JCM16814_08320 [Desulfobaculum senezii]
MSNLHTRIIVSARDTATATFRRTSASVQGLTRNVMSLQGALVGLGAGVALHHVLDQFATLDDGLIGIKKTTGISGDALAGLGDNIQQLTTTIPATTAELLGIAQAAGQLGVQGKDDILAFTETVGMLGMATDMQGEEAATTLARMLNVAGEAASEVDTLGAVIVALGNQFAATESEIAAVGTEVGQATAAFEVSSAEAAALGAALKSMGVRAELGGSAVGRVFRAIDSAIRAGGDQLRELERLTGRTGTELRRIFATDSPEAFRLFVAGLGGVIDSGGSAAAELEKFGLKGEEILKVLPTIATRSDEVGRALRIALQEVKNGTALTDEATEASKSFRKQMDLTRNTLNMAAADIGEELAPAVLEASKAFREFVTENKGEFAEFANDAVRFSDSLAPVASDISDLTSSAVSGWNSLPDEVKSVGFIGAIVGGKKGVAVLGMSLALMDTLRNSFLGIRAAAAGELSWDDVRDASPEEMVDLLHKLEIARKDRALMNSAPTRGRVIDKGALEAEFKAQQKPKKDKPPKDAPKETSTSTAQDSFTMSPALSGYFTDHPFDARKQAEDTAFADALAKQKQALADFHTEYTRVTEGETALAEEAARAQAEAWERAGADRLQVQEWLSAKLEGVEEQRLAASREAADGMARALSRYVDEASNWGAQMETFVGGSLHSLEDQLVNVTTTGKFAWRDMVSSMAADLSRMLIQQQITGPLAALLGGASSAEAGGVVSMFAGLFHSGGVVGEGGMSRGVSPAAFVGAPRYHSGGIAGLAPDEVPAILRRREEVLTEDDPRHRDNLRPASTEPPQVNVRVVNVVDEKDTAAGYLGSAEGERTVMNIIRKNRQTLREIV